MKKEKTLPWWSSAAYLYEVLKDKPRTIKLREAINQTVKKGDIVADLGAGSAILSLFSVLSGAECVYAIEDDLNNFKAAKIVIEENNADDKIVLINDNVLKVELPQKVDVVICELLSTGLLDELQVTVMNYAMKNFLKKNGKIIPIRFLTFGEFVNTDYVDYGLELKTPRYEWPWIKNKSIPLSEKKTIHNIDFREINKEVLDVSGHARILRGGTVNGFRLSSKTFFTEEIVHDTSNAFCPPIVIPLMETIKVEKDDFIGFHLAYKFGHGYSSLIIDAKLCGEL